MDKLALRFSFAILTALVCLSTAAGARAANSVTLLEQSVARTVVRVEAGDDGETAVNFALALPGRVIPQVRILSEDVVSAPARAGEREESGERITVSEPRLFRGVWTASVGVALEWEEQGRWRRSRALTIAVDHPGPEPAAPPGVEPDGARERFAPFLNDSLARRLLAARTIARREPGMVEDTFARSANWLRIEIDRSGIYTLDYAALRSALGAAVDLVDPSTLRVFGSLRRVQPRKPSDPAGSWVLDNGLREHAIRVEASEATLVPGDRVIMFLPGPEGWSDEYDAGADWLDHEENVWSTRHSLWLTWEEAGAQAGDFPAVPMRMPVVAADPVGTPDRILEDARIRTHAEQNLGYNPGLTPDAWVWTGFIDRDEARRHEFASPFAVGDSVAWIRTRPLAETNGARRADNSLVVTFRADYEVSGTSAAVLQWLLVEQRSPGGHWMSFSFDGLQPGSNFIRVTNRSDGGVNNRNPLLSVDLFDVHWRGELRPDGAGHIDWMVPEFESVPGTWRYRLRDAQSRLDGAVLLDLSEPFVPRWIEPGSGRISPGEVSFDVAIGDSTRHRFQASTRAGLRAPLRIERHRPRLLRDLVSQPDGSPGTGYDYLILAPEIFLAEAEDLANLRRAELLGQGGGRVAAVDLQDVYDQFGHGGKDPAAMRNYVKFLYEVDPRLSFVMLFGDANRDSRGVLPNSNEDFCPTWVEDAWPYFPDRGTRLETLVPFARDDWFVSLDDPYERIADFDLDLPDLAVGRFPATNPTEAARLVDFVVDYELGPEPGPWKNSILLCADDERGGNGDWEFYHIEKAEKIAEELLPRAMDRRKLYLTEYVGIGSARSKPAARADFIDAWSAGTAIVHYIGHGSPQQMADEVVFRIEDTSALTNGRKRPLFLAFSCDVSIFDHPSEQSMSEALVLQPAGGAIATIAATYVTFVGQNNALTDAFYARLYPDAPGSLVPRTTLGRSAAIGTALVEAKVINVSLVAVSRRINDAKYVILGDPGLRLQSPEENATIVGDVAQRLRTGQLEITGGSAPGLSAGDWDFLAAESADSVTYVSPLGLGSMDYVLPGNVFFSGHGPFNGGAADVTLRTPAVMRLGQNGRVRLLLEDGARASVGSSERLPVEKGSLDTDDRVGPTIEFADFSPGQTVYPGQELVAVITDSSGVNVLGSVGANSILVDFDEAGVSVDLTDRFVLDESSYIRGTVPVTVPADLGQGAHSLTLSAGDMVGNVSLEKIEFQVADVVRSGIGRHAPFPNPFADATRFVVEVRSAVVEPVEVSLDLYTVGGAHVSSLRATVDGSGRAVLPWEGRDRRGDELANGTYLYVVRARFGGSKPFTEKATGRVVLMR